MRRVIEDDVARPADPSAHLPLATVAQKQRPAPLANKRPAAGEAERGLPGGNQPLTLAEPRDHQRLTVAVEDRVGDGRATADDRAKVDVALGETYPRAPERAHPVADR